MIPISISSNPVNVLSSNGWKLYSPLLLSYLAYDFTFSASPLVNASRDKCHSPIVFNVYYYHHTNLHKTFVFTYIVMISFGECLENASISGRSWVNHPAGQENGLIFYDHRYIKSLFVVAMVIKTVQNGANRAPSLREMSILCSDAIAKTISRTPSARKAGKNLPDMP